jgi:hypothetical protein
MIKELLENEEWLRNKYLVDRLPSRAIGKLVGCSRIPVIAALKRFGIPLYKAGDLQKGTKIPEERRQRIIKSHIGMHLAEKHPGWKGENAGYEAIHYFVRARFKQPECCQMCGKKYIKLDLANISQEYKRDLSDWEYLCRRCHMTKDGRLENFKKVRATRCARRTISSVPLATIQA